MSFLGAEQGGEEGGGKPGEAHENSPCWKTTLTWAPLSCVCLLADHVVVTSLVHVVPWALFEAATEMLALH